MSVVEGKTAALFWWALRSGARLGGLREEQIEALGRVGTHIGVAFQLIDDLLDVEGDAAEMGKVPLIDLREGKLTWPLIIAVEERPELLEQIREVMGQLNSDPEGEEARRGLRALVGALKESAALQDTRREAERHIEAAREALSALPSSASKAALETVLDTITARRA